MWWVQCCHIWLEQKPKLDGTKVEIINRSYSQACSASKGGGKTKAYTSDKSGGEKSWLAAQRWWFVCVCVCHCSCVAGRVSLVTHYKCQRDLSPKPAHLLLRVPGTLMESMSPRRADIHHPPPDFHHWFAPSHSQPPPPPHLNLKHPPFWFVGLLWRYRSILALHSECCTRMGFRERLQLVSWSAFSKVICHSVSQQNCALISRNGSGANRLVLFTVGNRTPQHRVQTWGMPFLHFMTQLCVYYLSAMYWFNSSSFFFTLLKKGKSVFNLHM